MMICKNCGLQFSGTRCPKCGTEVSLRKRSTDLDMLIEKTENLQGTFEEGYQNGFREGYANGRKDAEEKSSGGIIIPRHRLSKFFLYLAATLFIVILLGVLTGNGIGQKKGYEKGWEEAFTSEDMENRLRAKYREGYNTGFELGKKDKEEINPVQPEPVDEKDPIPESTPESDISQKELPEIAGSLNSGDDITL